jgi:DNA-binding CsgD family transcriptional regulator
MLSQGGTAVELLERETDLARLAEHYQQAAAGHGRVVLVGGEAGIGKTALVDAFCRGIADEVTALRAWCDALSTPAPLGSVRDLAPQLGLTIDEHPLDRDAHERLFRETLAAFAARPGPTVVIAEDAHWADGATLDLLRFLGRRIGGLRTLIVVTYRDDEIGPDHPLRLILGDLATAPTVQRMTLLPLSAEAVRRFAAGTGSDATALHHLTGGNPFFLTEVLATAGERVPASVGDAVLARAARLSPDARAMLDVAAVIGSTIDVALLQRVAGPVLDEADECIARGMLRATADGLAFRHALAREAILGAIAPPRRRLLHARVLAALREEPEAARDLPLLAHHAEAAGDREAVLEFAISAAEQAAAMHAHREAAAQYARALRFATGLPPDQLGALLEARSYECYVTGQLREAIDAGQAALKLWRQTGNRLKEGDTQRRLSRLYWYSARTLEANVAASAALEILELLPAGPELAMAYSNQSQLCMLASNMDEAITWGEKAIALAERFGETETMVHALLNVGTAGDLDDSHTFELIERSLRLARENGLTEHASRAYTNLASRYAELYRFGRAEAYLNEGIAYCAEHDLDPMRYYLLAERALVLGYQGRWRDAVDVAQSVIDRLDGSPNSRFVALMALGRVQARQGAPDAGATLDEALALALSIGELQRIAPVRAARTEAALLSGDRERTVEEARELGELGRHQGIQWLWGEVAWMRRQAGEQDVPTDGMTGPYALQLAGDWSGAAAAWQALGCPYEEARALAESDDPTDIRRAITTFERLDAQPAIAQAISRLRSLGVRDLPLARRGPRPATRANPAGLTQREVEVLTLIAQGLRNAEIAERLYMTPKTVSHHITAILAKLGVSSRTAAARAAAELGIISAI